MTDESLDYLAIADRMDMRRLELDKENEQVAIKEQNATARAQALAKQERWTALAMIFGSISAAAAVVGVSYVIYLGVRGPDAEGIENRKANTEQMQTCVEAGGTWLPASTVVGSEGMCVAGGGK